ncbi:MAG TPA: trypsin-like peptidase domain-containing protein [Segeticoccus sp.]|uniref:S1C family serine protease n=1 Tax=Segeticoccus sp. TaxID=2706531 RepID=UPI002D7E1967|nr:trypsin-like peptidase domain-containing protein [Segeticoccus sp.]HET8599894.1 trypsin-like peptidase domain-containing protein [Segeticoccus sp.]
MTDQGWRRPGDAPPPPQGPAYPPPPQYGSAPYGARPSGPRAPTPAPAGVGQGLVIGLVVGAVVLALVAGLLGGAVGALVASRRVEPLPPPTASSSSAPAPPRSVAAMAARVLPSVVTLRVSGGGEAGTGSGFVIRQDGYILTNNHVVAVASGGGQVTVEFSNGQRLPARVVGRDASYDLAVVKVARDSLPVLRLARSAQVRVGDPVVAVGAPLGLESTVTSGIVSAVDRPVSTAGEAQGRSFLNAIQTDAAINPGNSGGPLLDDSGEVIGVNTAIARIPGASRSGQSGSIGLGFAIPSDQARRTAEQLIATGHAAHPIIGVTLDLGYSGPGAKVLARTRKGPDPVVPGGPAARAGIHPGDLIVAIDGERIRSAEELIVAIRAHAVGDTVKLTIRRDGTEHRVTMKLAGRSD